MAESRFQRLQALFDAALDLPESEWGDFASKACGDDAALRADLSRLLERQRGEALMQDQPILRDLDLTLRQVIPDAFAEGSQIGPYRIVEWLGDGGMGRVYRAVCEQGAQQDEVALKLIRAELLNPALLGRFSTECRVLSTLSHPGICRFLDSGAAPNGAPYVAMELVRGGQPLEDYCDAHVLGIRQRLQLLRKVLTAVAHAHHHLIVHRDIKSGNVLVDHTGEPKLLDFGIAKSIADAQSLQRTATAERFLTPAYAAPEQLRGESVGVGCDIYAIGLLAYKLLCGRLPFEFEGLRAGEVERLVLEVPPPPMSRRVAADDLTEAAARGMRSPAALARSLAGDLDTIVATCLRKSPDERYATVEQLDAELLCVVEGLPIGTRSSERGYRLRKFIARNRIVVGATAAVFVSLVAALTIALFQARSLAEQRNQAIVARDRAQHAIELLQSSFLAADPARVAGADVRIRDVLDSARPRLDQLRQSQPETYASLAATLAQVEFSLGEDSSAADLSRAALQALSSEEANRELRAKLLLIAGRALTAMGDVKAARKALEEARSYLRDDDPEWNVAMGLWLIVERRYDEALVALQVAVSALDERPVEDDLAVEATWALARALENLQREQAAIAVMDRLLARLSESLPEDHPRIVLTRMQRMLSLRVANRYEEALAEAEQITEQVRGVYGADSTMLALANARLGTALFDVRRSDDAARAFRASLDGFRAKLGMGHLRTIKVALNLAETLGLLGTHDREAEQLFEESLRAIDQRVGAASNVAAYFRVTYCGYLLSRKRVEQAAEVLTSDAARQGYAAALKGGTRGLARQRLREVTVALHCGAESSELRPICRRVFATAAELERASAEHEPQG